MPAPSEASKRLAAGDIHSQANNFLQALQSAVDPRTGQFNLAITVPLGQANDMGGPSLPFTLAFSTLGSNSNWGFGLGWALLYSQLTAEQDIWSLRLSSGEQFAVDLERSDMSIGGQLAFDDYKLKAMRVSWQAGDVLRIEHKSGEVELLRRPGGRGSVYELYEMRSQEGRSLFLDWLSANGVNFLQAIRDQKRTLATIDYNGTPKLILEPGSPAQATVEFLQANDRLSGLRLPEIAEPFTFDFRAISVGKGQQLLFPFTISGPTGAEDTLTWSTTATTSHQLPSDAPIEFLPRVLSWRHAVGTATPALIRSYEWVGDQNFLGGRAQAGYSWKAGRDFLYQLRERYEYSVIETQEDSTGKGKTVITRKWERHHLPLSEISLTGECETTQTTEYAIDYDATWENQIPQCQLPHVVKSTYRNLAAGTEHSEETVYEYDEFGNTLSTRFPTHVKEVSEYYPASGNVEGCPRDASGMVRFLKQKTVFPAPEAAGAAPVLSTRYEYEDLPSLIPGEPPHAVVSLEELKNETTGNTLEVTRQTYERQDVQHYGRQTQAVTTLGGKSTTTCFDYSITQDEEGTALLWTTTTIQGFEQSDSTCMSSGEARSLLSGQSHCERSAAGVDTLYRYDRLGRIVSTTLAADTDYQAVRTCAYHIEDDFIASHAPRLGEELAAHIGLEETDATGQRKRTWLDGSGQPVLVQLEDLDNRPGMFFDITSIRYDAWGREIEQITQDWQANASQLFELVSSTGYDDWGLACRHTAANGVITHTLNDPSQQRVELWQESSTGGQGSKLVTYTNTAGSPVEVFLYDDKGVPGRTTEYLRDGLDRVVEQHITLTDGTQRVTGFEYDDYSRVLVRWERFEKDEQTYVRRVRWTYAPHSDGDHPESVVVEIVKEDPQDD